MIDFSNCQQLASTYGGSELKKRIKYKNEFYMLKFPDPSRAKKIQQSYINNQFSEYIGCHIFESVGIPVQKTLLGIFKDKDKNQKICVACRDFKNDGIELSEFSKLPNSITSTTSSISHNKVNTDLKNIYAIIQEAIPEKKQTEVIRGFWDMFVIDCLIGNNDRHLDNWGVTSDFSFAPIYDCGSSFYPLVSIEGARDYLSDPSLLKGCAINIHSVYSFNGQKIQYSKIGELDIPELKQALKRVGPRIDLEKIKNIIYDTPYLAQELKDLYYQSIEIRYNTYLKKEIDKSLGKDTRSKTQIRKAERALRHQKTFSKNEGQNR